jgi:hypothetical protein
MEGQHDGPIISQSQFHLDDKITRVTKCGARNKYGHIVNVTGYTSVIYDHYLIKMKYSSY